MGALDNYSLVFVIFINLFRQLKDWVGQVLFLVSCPKGQVEKYVNVETWGPASKRVLPDQLFFGGNFLIFHFQYCMIYKGTILKPCHS